MFNNYENISVGGDYAFKKKLPIFIIVLLGILLIGNLLYQKYNINSDITKSSYIKYTTGAWQDDKHDVRIAETYITSEKCILSVYYPKSKDLTIENKSYIVNKNDYWKLLNYIVNKENFFEDIEDSHTCSDGGCSVEVSYNGKVKEVLADETNIQSIIQEFIDKELVEE